jgi:hypothetical protein
MLDLFAAIGYLRKKLAALDASISRLESRIERDMSDKFATKDKKQERKIRTKAFDEEKRG